MSDDRKEFTHPSYGMIAFNRSMNGRPSRLFGSSLDEHYGTVRISIGSGTRIHELNMDRYHGSLRGEHIEVEMSAAQFAEVLTHMNQGAGIPCTIRHLAGKRIEDPPPVATETRKIQQDFDKTIHGYAVKAKEYADEIIKLCERLPAKSRERIRINLDVIRQQLTSNVPFVLKQFNEAATRVVTAAKFEIDTFVQHAITNVPHLEDTLRTVKLLSGDAQPEAEPPKRAVWSTKTTLENVNEIVSASENKTRTFRAEHLATAIDGYLKEFEQLEQDQDVKKSFYNASAIGEGPFVEITYISYQGASKLVIEEAEKYLAWLDAGNIGRHYEALK